MAVDGKRFPKELLPFLYILLDNYKNLNDKQISNPATQLLADNMGAHLNTIDSEYFVLNFQDYIETRLESIQEASDEFLFMYRLLRQMQICYKDNWPELSINLTDNINKVQICLKHYFATIIALDMVFTSVARSKINIDPYGEQAALLNTKFYVLPEFPVYMIKVIQECKFKLNSIGRSATDEFINLTTLSLKDSDDRLKHNVIAAFKSIVSLNDANINQIILNSSYK